MDFQTFSSKIQPWMLDSSGRFLGPQSGVNYAFEGMTPEQAYAAAMQQYSAIQDSNADSPAWLRNKTTQDQMLDPSWKEGVIDTKKGVLGNWGVPLAMLAAPAIASQLGFGAGTGGADATVEFGAGGTGAEVVPNANMSLADQYASYGAGGGGVTGFGSQPAVGGLTSTLRSVGNFLKSNPSLATLAAGALGAAASGNTTTSASKDPWAPAQPYLLQNLAQNQAMSNQYNANPFSNEQKAAYQGLLNTVANSQAAGNGLLGMASNFGKSSRGVIPQSAALPTGVTAPQIDWSQYANFGGKR